MSVYASGEKVAELAAVPRQLPAEAVHHLRNGLRAHSKALRAPIGSKARARYLARARYRALHGIRVAGAAGIEPHRIHSFLYEIAYSHQPPTVSGPRLSAADLAGR